MKIISILNSKGGTGKTTMAINIANCLSLDGKRSVILDADPQESCIDWMNARKSPLIPVLGIGEVVKDDYDYIIVDGPSKIENIIGRLVAQSDFVIIPITMSPLDIWDSRAIVNAVKKSQKDKNGRPVARFLFNRVIKNTKIRNDIESAIRELDIECFKSIVSQRIVFPDSLKNGECVFNSKNDDAKLEIQKVCEEVKELI